MSRIFISHSSVDSVAALAMRQWLSENGIRDVFLDVDPNRGLVAGDRWQEALKAAVDHCEAVLFMISPAWVESKWCLAEFLVAKTLHKRIFGIVVVPVPIERIPAEMTAEWQLCDLVAGTRRTSIELTVDGAPLVSSFAETGLHLLRRGLDRAGLGAPSFSWPPPLEPTRAPYRGLRSLDVEDAAIFFGRDAMIVRALDRIRGLVDEGVDNCLIILGSSGSGKSSFLRAGLMPRLLRNDVLFLPLPVIRPEMGVINGPSGLVGALAGAFARFGAKRGRGSIKEALASADGLAAILRDLVALGSARMVHLDGENHEPVIVVAIDQAEELFNAEGAEEAADFLSHLRAAAATSLLKQAPRLVFLATIRSDRYELLQSHETIVGLKKQLLDLTPIPLAEFKSVIEGPALRVSESGRKLTIDPELAEELIADAGGPDALPLLAFTLERLYLDYGSEDRLTLAHYKALGGVRGSIDEAVKQAFANPATAPAIPASREAQLAGVRVAFIPWLARILPETGVPARRVARLAEIPVASRTLVERLVAARLLVADRRDGVDFVEVVHESLLRQWAAVAAWLQTDVENLTIVEAIERAADQWERNGRLEPWLDHRAERLQVAQTLLEREDFRRRVGCTGADYVSACVERERREHQERADALEREAARLAEIAAAQNRTQSLQRSARWTLVIAGAAVAAGLVLGVLQHRKNVALNISLGEEQASLGQARANLLTQLAIVERLRGNPDAALRFSIYAARMSRETATSSAEGRLATDRSPVRAFAEAELATLLARANWTILSGAHTGSVADAHFSRDGRRVVTASADGTAAVWDASSGRKLVTLPHAKMSLWSAVFSPDGAQIAIGASDRIAHLWDVATTTEVGRFVGHEDKVTTVAFSPSAHTLLTGSFDRTARIWDIGSRKTIAVLRGHTNTVQSAMFDESGSRVVTASDDGTVRLWDVATAREVARFDGHLGAAYYAAFNAGGSRIVAAYDDKTALVWDIATGKVEATLRGHKDYVNAASFSPDGSKVLTASADRTARLWDAATGKEIAALRGHEDYVNTAFFSPDGRHIVTGSRDRTARMWDVEPPERAKIFGGSGHALNAARFSPDNRSIVTASVANVATIWDVATARPLMTLRGHVAPVRSATFSPDGTRIVTASEDRSARVWDVATGRQLARLAGHENWVMAAVFDPTGTKVATASWDGTARLFDAATGAQLKVLRGASGVVGSVAFSPDGRSLATASWNGTASLWDVATGDETTILRGHDGNVRCVAFSRDGRRLLTTSDDRTTRLWDVATGKELLAFYGHEDGVTGADFSPDMREVVTASSDRTARVWDAATARQLDILQGHDEPVVSAQFAADGARVLTGSTEGTARLWTVRRVDRSLQAIMAEACARTLGTLSKMTRDDMKFAGFAPGATRIDVCEGIKQPQDWSPSNAVASEPPG